MSLPKEFELVVKDVYVLNQKMFPVYLIRGEKNFLIDCAISPYRKILLNKLIKLLGASTLYAVLLTHSHYDHTGACFYLQNEFGFYLMGSERTVELLGKDKVLDYIKKLNKNFEKILNKTTGKSSGIFINLVPLKENEKIKIDRNRYIKVISTPGHTKCSISYLIMPEKILFPGDAAGVIERKGKIKPLFLSSYSDYKESLEKLIKVEAEYLCLPHNRYIKGKDKVGQFLSKSMAQTKRTGELIKKALENSTDPKIISDLILKKEFPNPVVEGPEEAFTINLEAMVKAVKREIPERFSQIKQKSRP